MSICQEVSVGTEPMPPPMRLMWLRSLTYTAGTVVPSDSFTSLISSSGVTALTSASTSESAMSSYSGSTLAYAD